MTPKRIEELAEVAKQFPNDSLSLKGNDLAELCTIGLAAQALANEPGLNVAKNEGVKGSPQSVLYVYGHPLIIALRETLL